MKRLLLPLLAALALPVSVNAKESFNYESICNFLQVNIIPITQSKFITKALSNLEFYITKMNQNSL